MSMPLLNKTSIGTSSNGIWEGDDPLHFAFPLLIMQTTLILLLTRALTFAFKPLRQPKVITEIVGGILLGPSALGRNEMYMKTIFPKWSTPLLESVASIGLLFFLFLVGLELDLNSIRRSGFQAFFIALAGISLPFLCGSGLAVILRNALDGTDKVAYAPFLVFMGVALSITAFPVLARILAELKLLNTRMGETAMAAAAFNDVAAWILLALAIVLAGNGGATHKSPLISAWVLLSGTAFVTFMALVARPIMARVARRYSSGLDETCMAVTLAGVLLSGFTTDFIGVHAIFGAFVFGLIIPKDGGFARRLIERIEDFVSVLLLPLYFASSGLKTNVATIDRVEMFGLLVLVIVTATAGKVLGTFAVAMTCRIPARESLTLGVLMNTKGLVELIVLNIGREKKVLNDEMFAILVLMALFTTFITTPIVMSIYNPSHRDDSPSVEPNRKLQSNDTESSFSVSSTPKTSFRILACLNGPGHVSSIISLIEGLTQTHLKLYVMHLLELTERSSSIVMARRNRTPFAHGGPLEEHDSLACAFEAYGQVMQDRVKVRVMSTISPLSTIHEDVCHVAERKEVGLIVLPFHKTWRVGGEDGSVIEDDMGHEWRAVTERVLKHAPCSVAVLVDRGFGVHEKGVVKNVCAVFFGGPDDREALELTGRMAEHPHVKVVVVRFLYDNIHHDNYSFSMAASNRDEERALDEAMVAEFRRKWDGIVEYVERAVGNLVDELVAVGRGGGYELIVVGRGRFPPNVVAVDMTAEHTDLGPVGDILTSSHLHVASSVLVVQHHAEEISLWKAQVGGRAGEIQGLD